MWQTISLPERFDKVVKPAMMPPCFIIDLVSNPIISGHAKHLAKLNPLALHSPPSHDFPFHHNPRLLLTSARTLFSNSGRLSLHIRAASTFAGLSSFGSAIILMTEIRIFSTLWIGLQRSEACS